MPFLKNIGIHARILSTAVILISASTFAVGYLGVGIINEFVTLRFNQRMEFMTRYLAMNAELGILIDETNLLNGLARGLLDEKDVAGVEIENIDHKILVSIIKKIDGPFKVIEKNVVLSEAVEGNTGMELITDLPGPSRIGSVRVKYSIRGIKDLVGAMKHRLMLIAVTLTLISCGIFYFISRSLVSPIISLAHTARQVSRGNRSVRADSGTTPEIIKLADAFNDMLDSIAQGRKTLVQAYEKMAKQETLAEMGKFSMMIAHEVKNPLAIIKSSLGMLKTDLNIPEDNMALTYAQEEILRLNELIESFLMFARPAKPHFEEIDLNKLVDQVLIGFDIQYNSGDIHIRSSIPDTPFYAKADFDLLSRGISNIIKNAVEANKEKGIVDVSIVGKGEKWMLWITDQGEGVPEALQKKVFEPFHTTKAKGTGLGLAFADQVVKAHGGSIRVENSKKGGAVFCISLFSDTDKKNYEVL